MMNRSSKWLFPSGTGPLHNQSDYGSVKEPLISDACGHWRSDSLIGNPWEPPVAKQQFSGVALTSLSFSAKLGSEPCERPITAGCRKNMVPQPKLRSEFRPDDSQIDPTRTLEQYILSGF